MADQDDQPTEVEADEAWDPVGLIQNALAEVDPDALVAGFICVVEWLEPDGTATMSLIHSPMPPWHREGMLKYASHFDTSMMYPVVVDMDDDDWDE